MPAVTRRPYRRRGESIGILRDLLAYGPLSTSQIADLAHCNRVTVLGWLSDGERAGAIHRLTRQSCKPMIWSLSATSVSDPPPEGPQPFEDLVRKMTPGRWHSATELAAFRDQLTAAVEADLLEICRRWYEGRPGRKARLYKLTLGGEVQAGLKPHWRNFEPVGRPRLQDFAEREAVLA